MEQHNTSLTSETTSQIRIPTIVWVLLAAAVIGLLAVFVFKVAVGTVFTYVFVGLMVFSHLFMHGGHGSHNEHNDQTSSQISADTQTEQDKTHAGHGGCH